MQLRKFNKYVAGILAIPLIAGSALLLSSDAPKSPICREGYVFQDPELGKVDFGINYDKNLVYVKAFLFSENNILSYSRDLGIYEIEINPADERGPIRNPLLPQVRINCD